MMVKVYVNEAGPFEFIFDTGASMTVHLSGDGARGGNWRGRAQG